MTTELQFLKECDQLCQGDELLGTDRDLKVRNYLSLAAMIDTRIRELEKEQKLKEKKDD